MKKPLRKFPENFLYKDVFNKKIKKTKSSSKFFLSKGVFGLRSLETFKISFAEVEAIRKIISFNYKSVKVWFNISFNIPLKAKPLESRMGKGKGKLQHWVCTVKKGDVFLELDSLYSKAVIDKIFRLVAEKLQVKSKKIKKF